MKTIPTLSPVAPRAADSLPVLYVKEGCPWCEEAIAFLRDHGVSYRERVVSGDPGAFGDMQRASGQTKAPVLDWRGDVLADFGVDELVAFLRAKNVKLEDS
jgi:glutaredoxin 3